MGGELRKPVTLIIGWSSSLILNGFLSRHTEDVDIVDEVPEALRALGPTLESLENKLGLQLAHFQSPTFHRVGWVAPNLWATTDGWRSIWWTLWT